jgi:hypothetical protein
MADANLSSKSVPVQITEGCARLPPVRQRAPDARAADEAAVYDRQIRLWGLEAQQRCARRVAWRVARQRSPDS